MQITQCKLSSPQHYLSMVCTHCSTQVDFVVPYRVTGMSCQGYAPSNYYVLTMNMATGNATDDLVTMTRTDGGVKVTTDVQIVKH